MCDYSKDEFEVQVEFRSLRAMIRTIAEAYEQRAFFVEGGYLDADWPLWRGIAAQLNPECPAWGGAIGH